MKLSSKEKREIKLITDFIKNNFKNSDKEYINLQNFKKLIKFINENNINMLTLDLCNLLIEKTKVLKNTINCLSKNESLDEIVSSIENENIKDFYNNLKICANNFIENPEIDNVTGDPVYDYFKQIKKIPLLTEEEKEKLPLLIKQGDENAINRYVEANLRLVIYIAQRFKNNKRNIPFLDLIEEGNIALINAVKTYDSQKGTTFGTYASKCIRNCIYSYICSQYTDLKISEKIPQNIYKLKTTAEKLQIQIDPKDEESLKILSSKTGFSTKYIKELIELDKINTISLYETISSDSSNDITYLINLLPDDKIDVETDAYLRNFINDFENCSLSEKYKEILKLRSGYYGKVYSLEEVGKRYNVTRERIRQLEGKAKKRAARDLKLKKYYNF